jgi:hypothetical protein
MPSILGRQFKDDPWDTDGDPVQEFHDARWGHCDEECALLLGLRELEAQIRADERGREAGPARKTTFPVEPEALEAEQKPLPVVPRP